MIDSADWQKENRERREQQDDKKPPSPSASPKKPPSPLVKPQTSRSPSPNGKFGLAAVAANNGTPVGACSPNSQAVDANNQKTANQPTAQESAPVISQKVLQDHKVLQDQKIQEVARHNKKIQEAEQAKLAADATTAEEHAACTQQMVTQHTLL